MVFKSVHYFHAQILDFDMNAFWLSLGIAFFCARISHQEICTEPNTKFYPLLGVIEFCKPNGEIGGIILFRAAPRCECKEGFVRSSANGGRCIRRKACRPRS
ncbi:uncharacterized protein [Centruroides vittatus]|uniref:uncharacterized protein n=1 Tax=Centruroides vittatus TaxID=120091 RepID=UPI00350F2D33